MFPSPPPLFPIQAEHSWGSRLEFCDTSLYPSGHPSSRPNFHPWELGMVPVQGPWGRSLWDRAAGRGDWWLSHRPSGVLTVCHFWALLTFSWVILLQTLWRRGCKFPVTQKALAIFFTVTQQVNGRSGYRSAFLRTQQLEKPRSAVWKMSPGFPSVIPLAAVSAYVYQSALHVVFFMICSYFVSSPSYWSL